MINTPLCPRRRPLPTNRKIYTAEIFFGGGTLQNMASRLIKIRLPFLFPFCLEMFKEKLCENVWVATPKKTEGEKKRASVTGGSSGDPAPADTSEKSTIRKFVWVLFLTVIFLRLSRRLEATDSYFQESALRQKGRRIAACPGETLVPMLF